MQYDGDTAMLECEPLGVETLEVGSTAKAAIVGASEVDGLQNGVGLSALARDDRLLIRLIEVLRLLVTRMGEEAAAGLSEGVASSNSDAECESVPGVSGYYKSTISCAQCGHSSSSLELYTTISVEIPPLREDIWYLMVHADGRKEKCRFSVDPRTDIETMRDRVGALTGISAKRLATTLLFGHETQRLVKDEEIVRDIKATGCVLGFYEVTEDADAATVFIMHHEYVQEFDDTDDGTPFGVPMLIVRGFGQCDESMDPLFHIDELLTEAEVDGNVGDNESELTLFAGVVIKAVLIWKTFVKDAVFNDDGDGRIEDGHQDPQSPGYVTLGDCVREHLKEESIDGWDCDKCRATRRGVKTLKFWSLPDTLLVHLKRFVNDPSTGFTTKVHTVADIPPAGLELNSFVSGTQSGMKGNNDEYVYDLLACSNHFGGLHRGHYTTTCRRGDRWLLIDDNVTKEIKDVSEINKSASAYVLAFQRVRQNGNTS
ncbi:hypothetical protein HK102_001354, partial [Quaeritorhiza haematococci]